MTSIPNAPMRAGRGARVAYASLFVVVLPALLVGWASRLDALIQLPAHGSPAVGAVLTMAGVVLMASGAADLRRLGRGLPMSPFPPERLVTRGVYGLIADPLYVGAVFVSAGIATATGSAAGLWIVTPALALAEVAWVMGFERDLTRERFGRIAAPLLRLPDATDERTTARDRVAVLVLALLPSLLAYQAIEFLGAAPDARPASFAWETRIPVLPWTEAFYALGYPFVLLAPFVAARGRDLRRFAVRGLWATAAIVPFWLLVSMTSIPKAVPGDGFWQTLMLWERSIDRAPAVFPAFHVVWVGLTAELYSTVWPRARWIAWTLAAAIAASCVTTGMHAAIEVVSALVVYALVVRGHTVWRWMREEAEQFANSWGEVTIGPVRLINHGIYVAIGGAVGVLVAVRVAGRAELWWVVALTLAGIVGAGLWAQIVEGSPQLLRPYGYFGGVLGLLLGMLGAVSAGADGWLLAAAAFTGLSFAQAIGRFRCLVQGCCHGREAPPTLGIRVRHPRSRVVRLAGLERVPIHPTQLYSMLWMMLVGLVMLRLWSLAAPLQFITGCYFFLVGVGRFVEEHFRGEPQTAELGGLRLYQWLSMAFVAGGAAVTTLGATPAPPAAAFDPSVLPVVLGIGVICYIAGGVDFPRSNRRFSRLV